jgi:hypothetical protein
MSKLKFNRKYREYQPSTNTVEGPPTQRICKPKSCNISDVVKKEETDTKQE